MALHEDWRKRLDAVGRKDADLARRINKTPTALSRIMTGQRKDLRQSEIDGIEQAIAEFEGKSERPPGLIPLLGYAAAGGDDHIVWNVDQPLDWVEAPPIRAGSATEVVAVRVHGDSMEPRLFSGETIYIGLNLAPARNGDAVIEFKDGSALVKSYAGRRDDRLYAQQYNPSKLLDWPATKVRGVHAVLWRR